MHNRSIQHTQSCIIYSSNDIIFFLNALKEIFFKLSITNISIAAPLLMILISYSTEILTTHC